MSESSTPQQARAANVETGPQHLLQYHHTSQDDDQPPPYSHPQPTPQPEIQPTPEQLYQYHLFMNTRAPYSPPCSSSAYDSPSSSSSNSSVVVESVVAIIGMIMMLVVGILGYQQMRQGTQDNKVPDMSGVIVALAAIPIAVTFFLLLIKLAVRRERKLREREGQIALPFGEDSDGISLHTDLEGQSYDRPQGIEARGLMAGLWGSEQAPMLVDEEEDAPPAYDETQTHA